MDPLVIVFAALLGLAFGSFVNVVVHRVPRGLSLVRPPSACPHCGKELRPWHNIPVISYVALRGKCGFCAVPISVRYPLVELAVAMLWVAAVIRFESIEQAALVALTSAVLVALAAIDLEHHRLPNAIVYPSTVASVLWVVGVSVARPDVGVAVEALACGAAYFLLLLLIALIAPGGMGMGDVKLAAFLGIVTGRFGWEVTVLTGFASFFIGGFVGIVALLFFGKGRKAKIPFGPSMAAAAILALFAGAGPVQAWLGL